MRKLPSVIVAVLFFSASHTASAIAIFSVTANSTFEFQFPPLEDLVVDYNQVVVASNFGTNFGGSTYSAAVSANNTLPVTQTLFASGMDSGSTQSSAGASATTRHLITIGQPIQSTFVPFLFTFSWDLMASVDDPLFESAAAGVAFVIENERPGNTFEPNNCLVDGVVQECVFNPVVDTALGQGTSSGSRTVSGFLAVTLGGVRDFRVTTSIGGIALSSRVEPPEEPTEVPEPTTLALLVAGLLGGGLWRCFAGRRVRKS
jgi:hypothetical protein